MILAALLLVQSTPAAAPTPTPTAAAESPKVCRRTEPTIGSRMGLRRVCHTAAEWAALDAAVQRDASTLRRQR